MTDIDEDSSAETPSPAPAATTPSPKPATKRAPARRLTPGAVKAAPPESTETPAPTRDSANHQHSLLLASLLALCVLLLVQVVLSIFLLTSQRQTSDTVKAQHDLQVCEAKINLTATSQAEVGDLLRKCLGMTPAPAPTP